jgi:hypothetical protein
METLTSPHSPMMGGAWRGLSWLAGAVATLAAAAVGAVLLVVFAASVVVMVLMASVVVAFAGFALRAKRMRRPADPSLIEAHNVGGHSWIAYGWRDSVR